MHKYRQNVYSKFNIFLKENTVSALRYTAYTYTYVHLLSKVNET